MSARRRGRALAAGLLVAAALAGCSSSGGADGSGKGYISGDGTITVLSQGDRPEPVALAGTTLEGTPLDLASLRGKVVVLNVWGSWCPPCRKEAPDLQKAYEALGPQGVAFVGLDVNEQGGKDAPLAFQRTFGITYPSLADDGGKSLLALRGAVSAKTIPSTLVLDPEGRIAVRVNGPTDYSTLTALVEDVLAGRDPKAA
jgi:thiol-disulfide isomerase/thioredoxin